jgi:hypothetical protein
VSVGGVRHGGGLLCTLNLDRCWIIQLKDGDVMVIGTSLPDHAQKMLHYCRSYAFCFPFLLILTYQYELKFICFLLFTLIFFYIIDFDKLGAYDAFQRDFIFTAENLCDLDRGPSVWEKGVCLIEFNRTCEDPMKVIL